MRAIDRDRISHLRAPVKREKDPQVAAEPNRRIGYALLCKTGWELARAKAKKLRPPVSVGRISASVRDDAPGSIGVVSTAPGAAQSASEGLVA
jgi:hypothetical protein